MDKEEIQEFARRKQVILKSISDLVSEAQVLLADAKQIATDAGMTLEFDSLVSNRLDESWYGSDASLC